MLRGSLVQLVWKFKAKLSTIRSRNYPVTYCDTKLNTTDACIFISSKSIMNYLTNLKKYRMTINPRSSMNQPWIIWVR